MEFTDFKSIEVSSEAVVKEEDTAVEMDPPAYSVCSESIEFLQQKQYLKSFFTKPQLLNKQDSNTTKLRFERVVQMEVEGC